MSDEIVHSHTRLGTDITKEALQFTEGHRGTKRDTEGHIWTQRDTEGQRGTQMDTEGHIGAQRGHRGTHRGT